MGEGPVQQKALIGPEDTTRFTGGFDGETPLLKSALPNCRTSEKEGRLYARRIGYTENRKSISFRKAESTNELRRIVNEGYRWDRSPAEKHREEDSV